LPRSLSADERAKVLRLPELRRALAAAPPPQHSPPAAAAAAASGAAAPAPGAAAAAAAGVAGAATQPEEGEAGERRRLALAREYLGLVATHPTPLPCVLFHLRRICKGLLTRYQARGRGGPGLG